MDVVVLQRGIGGPLNAAALLVRPPLRLLGRARWRGEERIPPGGVLIAANHVSWADPVALLDFLVAVGAVPRILAKQSLFDVPVLGRVLRHMDAVPVLRASGDAAVALRAAEEALRGGARVVIYPDGTLTKDPEGWPMVGKTGAARLALATGVPVVPVAQWGAHHLLPRTGRPRLWPRPVLDVLVGDPLDLSEFAGQPLTAAVLRRATDTIVDAVVALLEQLRGEPAPPRWDPRTHSRQVLPPAADVEPAGEPGPAAPA